MSASLLSQAGGAAKRQPEKELLLAKRRPCFSGLFCTFKSLGWRFPKGDKATPDTWLPLYCLFSFIFSASLKIIDIVGIAPILVFQSLLCVGEKGWWCC